MKLLPSLKLPTSLKTRLLHVSARRMREDKVERPDTGWIEPSGVGTGIVVYNPIVKKKVPLVLKNEGYATWYMCGPTVYDSAHIGHACSYVRLDVIRRVLVTHFGINLVTTMGITDIDDKIIKRSTDRKVDWKELVRFYEREFFEDMAKLNVDRPYICCRVSEHVPQIIQFVDKILHNQGAYVAEDGSVYFDTKSYGGYGKLGMAEPNAPTMGKRNAQDFALWKASKPGEPFWESPWGPGRPGWHIECSTMARYPMRGHGVFSKVENQASMFFSEIFGSNLDIHSGGVDLAFPHHENEEAQSCQHHGVSQWVNYWLHTGHLHSNKTKMSKSLGNSVGVSDLLSRYTADQFRLFCLSSHYRTGIEYTDQSMEASVTILKKIESFIDDCNNYVNGTFPQGNIDDVAVLEKLVETKEVVRSALADDFDTPKAVKAVTGLVSIGNKMLHAPNEEGRGRSTAVVAALSNYVTSILASLGMEINAKSTRQNSAETTDVIDSFVKFRCDVRNVALEDKSKDKRLLVACDRARNDLLLHGVQIKDHGTTSTWSIGGTSRSSSL